MIPAETRSIVANRAGGVCERCGRHWGSNVHHRKPRGMGGTRDPQANSPANLVLLCGSGTFGCHGEVESNRAKAYMDGWLVRRADDPELIPLVMRSGRTFRLDAEGGRHV